MITDQTI